MRFSRKSLKSIWAVFGVGALLAVAAIAGVSESALAADNTAPPSSSWGYLGSVTTDSGASVRWDNQGNSASNTVPRDDTQKITHTNGLSYSELPPILNNSYANMFGPDNGQGGLQMDVSQTNNLVNQAITISFKGGPRASSEARGIHPFLQVFQCWGAPGPDGKPDSNASSPDPRTCQLGTAGIGSGGSNTIGARPTLDEPMYIGGDLKPSAAQLPVLGIDGRSTPGDSQHNAFFNKVTTNEIDSLAFDGQGHAQSVFETQTGAEASFMGCGLSKGPSTSSCWLVAVPKTGGIPNIPLQNIDGPALSPKMWAQRLQVKLIFRDAPGLCSGDQAHTLSAGSEVVDTAMASWIPALCSSQKLATGYSMLSDQQVRTQQAAGSQPMALTTQESPGSMHAPVAISGVVLAFNIGKTERGSGNYLGPLPELKFNATLVAKLLTQSYQAGLGLDANSDAGVAVAKNIPWAKDFTTSIIHDAEFIELNPGISSGIEKGTYTGAHIQLETLRSDAASSLWQWVLQDPAANAFLNGCPDASGQVVNPFYSTRSYQGCSSQAVDLEKTAKARRDATVKPSTFSDMPAIYPPDTASYPLPGWYESVPYLRTATGPILDATGSLQPDPNKLPLSMADVYPRQDSMAITGKNAFRAVTPSVNLWCARGTDGCPPPSYALPGKWIDAATTPADLPARFSLAITDTSTAAKFGLSTAQLCDNKGTACVGADSISLSKEAARWPAPDAAGVQPSSTTADYAAGAYPITMPVYAAMSTKGMSPTEAQTYSKMLTFISTTGQVPGTAPGQLPPGYAPLTNAMKAQTARVAAALIAPKTTPAPLPSHSSPQPGPLGQGPTSSALVPNGTLPSVAPGLSGVAAPSPAGADGHAGDKATATTGAQAAAVAPADLSQVGSTAGGGQGFLQFALPIALGIGLIASLASPVLSRLGKTGARSSSRK